MQNSILSTPHKMMPLAGLTGEMRQLTEKHRSRDRKQESAPKWHS